MLGKIGAVFLLACLASQTHSFDHKLSFIHGEIASQNFSQMFYPNNLNDSLTINVKSGFQIALYFDHFNLEEGSGTHDFVCGDFVELIDGVTGSSITKMCGNSAEHRPYAPVLMDQKFRSTANHMIIRMVSDGSNVGVVGQTKPTGFRAYYTIEDIDECEKQSEMVFESIEADTNCQHVCINYPGGFRCTCDAGYSLAADMHSCYADQMICNTFDVSISSGVIQPPMYKDTYARNITCSWKLLANPGENLYLNFVDQFDVEAYRNNICLYDYIQIEDHGGVKGKFCGGAAPPKTLRSMTDWMKVTFHSDHFVEGTGFKINFESQGVRCKVPQLPAYSYAVNMPHQEADGYSYIKYGGQLKVKCQDGFWLLGNSKLNCLKDGTLSSKMPKCLGL